MKKIVLILILAVSVLYAKNIPLPKQSAYTETGLSVGIGVGIFNPTEDCDCLGVWQGQGEFFYKDWISGGIDVRFFGGDLDAESMILYQRYRLFSRFHFVLTNNFDIYLSPVLGLESTDISEFRKEMNNKKDWREKNEDLFDTLNQETICKKMFSLDGFSSGLEIGMGWAFSKYVGITSSAQYEYSFSKSQLLTLTEGLAFNLRKMSKKDFKNVKSIWITLESGFQRYFNRGVSDWANSWILGFQFGI